MKKKKSTSRSHNKPHGKSQAKSQGRAGDRTQSSERGKARAPGSRSDSRPGPQGRRSSALPEPKSSPIAGRPVGAGLAKTTVRNGDVVIGTVKRHPDGFGFLICEDRTVPDVYLPRQDMDGVMSGDRIEARVYPEHGGDRRGAGPRLRGEVKKILSRRLARVVGKIHLTRTGGLVVDESHGWGENLVVPPGALKGAKDGDMVAVQITQYPEDGKPLLGEVVAVIGDLESPLNDIQRVVHAQSLPFEFSAETLREAAALPSEVEPDPLAPHRRDLRSKNFVTIDGVTAKDFDDAIYVEQNRSGFRLWVAIADVSHYVKPGSAIDEDAVIRGTSSYFPNFVIPMLPEQLSNELCSLKPHVPRLTLVAEMQIGFEGELLEYQFFEAVIRSAARVTYGQAQELVDGRSIPDLAHVRADILRAADLARILMARRFKEGSLDLEMPETVLEIDAQGVPVDMVRSERLFAHRLIEELMLIANVAAAKFLQSHEIPALFRVHENPDPDNIEALERFLFSFAGAGFVGGGMLQKKLTKALDSLKDSPYRPILSSLTLRSMKQAKYSSDNVGHFGLAFPDYTHFTSPIRRYPDLIVHRLIKHGLGLPGYAAMSEEDLATAGTMLSACEQRAVKAERQIQSIKKARFAVRFLGQELDGMINSVVKFGLFVALREYDIDGLVKVESLGNERFEFDNERMTLRGSRSGTTYTLGDTVKVVITSADHESGQIDMRLVATESKATPNDAGETEKAPVTRGQRFREAIVRGKDLFTVSRRGLSSEKYGKKKSDREDRAKRGEATDDRGRVRKARFSKHR